MSEAVSEVALSTKSAVSELAFDWNVTVRVAAEEMSRVTVESAKAFVIVRTFAPTLVTEDTVYVNEYHLALEPLLPVTRWAAVCVNVPEPAE